MAKAAKVEQWAQLAGDLGVSRQSVYNWRKLEGAPSTPDVGEWREFMAVRGLKAGQSRDLNELKVLIAEQELEKKTRENQLAKGECIMMEDAVRAAQRATAIWTLALRAKLETESPARLVGKDIAELRAEIRAVTDELCAEVVKALEVEAANQT